MESIDGRNLYSTLTERKIFNYSFHLITKAD